MDELPFEAPPGGDVILSTRYIIGIAIITALAALTVCLRMYVRAVLSRSIGWDDWIMLIASLIMVVTNSFLIAAYHHGLGRHVYYLSLDQIPIIFKWLWAAEPTNLFAVYLVRVSIALFLLRLVPPKKKYTSVIWTTITLLTISDIYVFFVFFLQCRPIHKVWDVMAPGTCVSEPILASAIWLYQAISIPADIAFIAIPIFLFWGLKVAVRTRIALIVICCLGVLTSICAIVKTVLLPKLLDTNPDKSWRVAELCFWAPMELCVGIICGSIPILRPLLVSKRKSSSYQSDQIQHQTHSHKLAKLSRSTAPPSKVYPPAKPIYKLGRASISQEAMMDPEVLEGIRRTCDIEVTSGGGSASEESQGGYGHGWNKV